MCCVLYINTLLIRGVLLWCQYHSGIPPGELYSALWWVPELRGLLGAAACTRCLVFARKPRSALTRECSLTVVVAVSAFRKTSSSCWDLLVYLMQNVCRCLFACMFLCETEECCCNNFCFAESFPEKDPTQALKCCSLSISHMLRIPHVSNAVHGKDKGVSVLHVLSFLCSAGSKVCRGETPDLWGGSGKLSGVQGANKGPCQPLEQALSLQPALMLQRMRRVLLRC